MDTYKNVVLHQLVWLAGQGQDALDAFKAAARTDPAGAIELAGSAAIQGDVFQRWCTTAKERVEAATPEGVSAVLTNMADQAEAQARGFMGYAFTDTNPYANLVEFDRAKAQFAVAARLREIDTNTRQAIEILG